MTHCSCVQIAVTAVKALSEVRVTRKLLLPPACTSADVPTVPSAVPLTLLTVTVPPADVPLTVASDGTEPPPPGLVGLPFPPHPSMRDATVTNEIACAQNSRRDVFGLSMAPSQCNRRTGSGNIFSPRRAGAEPRDIVGFDVIFRRAFAAVAVPLAVCMTLVSARSQGQRPLQVSYRPSTVGPGDVAMVEVSGISGDAKITGTVLAQELTFHYDQHRQTWRALVGIDLDTKPGAYRLHILDDAQIAATQSLRVVPKQFRVRRLRVPAEFVEPPPNALEQIAHDSAALAAAYARASPKKWTGSFVLPVDGKPTSNFGTRSYYNGKPRAPHAGVDFVGAPGTPIRAANHGEVIVASAMYFTGNTVVIDYGERLISVFAHLSELRAKAGDTVEPNTIVGLVGSTGRVTGPHLHWSVRLNGKRVDPLSLVAATAGAEQ